MNAHEPRPTSSPGRAFKDTVFEQVENGSYVVYDRLEQKFQITNDAWHLYLHDDVKYAPLPRLPWQPASIPRDYVNDEILFKEISSFFTEHLDIANELLVDVYASFVMASWRPEDFTVVPYLFFLGPLASGKTRALECFHRLCYRGLMAASMSAASLFRAQEAWHPTLLLDETEIYNRENMVEVLALLNSGYRRGQYAIRVEKIDSGSPQIALFDTFGFKVLAGTQELAATLQSRCIITPMSRAVKHVHLFINEIEAENLRNKLLMYRFKRLGQHADVDVSRLSSLINNARVIELFISPLQVAPSEDVRQRLLKCMKQNAQSRLDAEQASIEARLFDAILKCEANVQNGKISTQAITEAFNSGLSEKEQANNRFTGRKVAALGFEKCRLTGGHAGFYYDCKLVERLKMRYYPPLPNLTSLSSLTSLIQLPSKTMENTVQGQTSSEVSEVSEVNPEPLPKPSVQEVLEHVRSCFREGTMEDWIALANQAGLTRKQAEELFQKLSGNELFWQDGNDGKTLWRWVKE